MIIGDRVLKHGHLAVVKRPTSWAVEYLDNWGYRRSKCRIGVSKVVIFGPGGSMDQSGLVLGMVR